MHSFEHCNHLNAGSRGRHDGRGLLLIPRDPTKYPGAKAPPLGCLISRAGERHQSVRHQGTCLRLRDPGVWDRVCDRSRR